MTDCITCGLPLGTCKHSKPRRKRKRNDNEIPKGYRYVERYENGKIVKTLRKDPPPSSPKGKRSYDPYELLGHKAVTLNPVNWVKVKGESYYTYDRQDLRDYWAGVYDPLTPKAGNGRKFGIADPTRPVARRGEKPKGDPTAKAAIKAIKRGRVKRDLRKKWYRRRSDNVVKLMVSLGFPERHLLH